MEGKDAYYTIFQSGEKFYLWYQMYHDVDEIASRDIHETAHALAQGGLKHLQTGPVTQVPDSGL
jgi:hypothetical protein